MPNGLIQLLEFLLRRLAYATGVLSHLCGIHPSELGKLCDIEVGIVIEERGNVEVTSDDLYLRHYFAAQSFLQFRQGNKHITLSGTSRSAVADEPELLELLIDDARVGLVTLCLKRHCHLLCHIFINHFIHPKSAR